MNGQYFTRNFSINSNHYKNIKKVGKASIGFKKGRDLRCHDRLTGFLFETLRRLGIAFKKKMKSPTVSKYFYLGDKLVSPIKGAFNKHTKDPAL